MQATLGLGVLMAAIAIVNATLMAWLWRFPMKPDGTSSAPRWGTNLHRGLGYVFIAAYGVLLFAMMPRAWEYRAVTAVSAIHGILGALIGVILVVKISVIRRFHRFGNRLPWIGGTLAATTLIVAALGIVPAWMVLRPGMPLSPELARGRTVVSNKCNQCHGASMIAGEREDARKWERITREMQRYSHETAGKEPITDDERTLATAFLIHTRGEVDDHEDEDADDDERDGRRRRRRG